MKHPVHIPDWKRWLDQAATDLAVAELTNRERFYADCAFKCQQAAEKTLKAYLYFRQVRDPWGHSCLDLLRWSMRFDPTLDRLESNCRILDKHYITSRYPNGLPSSYPHAVYGADEAEDCLRRAREIYSTIRGIIEPEQTTPEP